ncbi:DUF4166 domain-containing protein [Xanthobacter autotrophicus]|uniref:DUF4166 domain-containing protein n=1 Tax=Xanthobacter autotrophicus TaxID=280 RepID=UPI00372A02D3
MPVLFEEALGPDFRLLPPPLVDLHGVVDVRRWHGEAEVTQGPGLLARLVRAVMGFPPAGRAVRVAVTMERRGSGEVWVRDFAGRRFRSRLTRRSAGPGVRERFGLLSFDLGLAVRDGRLWYPVVDGRIAGVPLPRTLLPSSTSCESVDAAGRACFDVAIALPLVGLVVRYRGWLVPDGERG